MVWRGHIHLPRKTTLKKPSLIRVKNVTRRTASDKKLRDKAFNNIKKCKYDGYQRGLASVFYKLFDKRTTLLADKSACRRAIKKSNKALAEELKKLIKKI